MVSAESHFVYRHTGFNTYLSIQLAKVLLSLRDNRWQEILRGVLRLGNKIYAWPEAVHPRTMGGYGRRRPRVGGKRVFEFCERYVCQGGRGPDKNGPAATTIIATNPTNFGGEFFVCLKHG